MTSKPSQTRFGLLLRRSSWRDQIFFPFVPEAGAAGSMFGSGSTNRHADICGPRLANRYLRICRGVATNRPHSATMRARIDLFNQGKPSSHLNSNARNVSCGVSREGGPLHNRTRCYEWLIRCLPWNCHILPCVRPDSTAITNKTLVIGIPRAPIARISLVPTKGRSCTRFPLVE